MIIDGKKLAEDIKNDLAKKVSENKYKRKLTVIIVGENPASKIYVKNKAKGCEKIGVESEIISCDSSITEKELIEIINKLNKDDSVNGILVQLPLPKHINEKNITLAIDYKKDVDGFHPINMGNLALGIKAMQPCTPRGIMKLIESVHESVEGLNAVVVGRSNIVGKPVASLLINAGATVTITNSKTKNLKEICKLADILIVAIGKAKFITKDYVKENATVIDVGINRLDDKKICGDVDFDDVSTVCAHITPVPGGVGPMTIAMLLKNLVDSE